MAINSSDEKQERIEAGRGLIVSGWVILAFDLLIFVYYGPAERVGSGPLFRTIMLTLALVGVALIVAGYVMRNRAARLR